MLFHPSKATEAWAPAACCLNNPSLRLRKYATSINLRFSISIWNLLIPSKASSLFEGLWIQAFQDFRDKRISYHYDARSNERKVAGEEWLDSSAETSQEKILTWWSYDLWLSFFWHFSLQHFPLSAIWNHLSLNDWTSQRQLPGFQASELADPSVLGEQSAFFTAIVPSINARQSI